MSQIREEFASRINPVSINIETLEFLDGLIQNHSIERVLEFGSGVSTEFWSKKFQMRMLFPLIIREGMRKLHDQEFRKRRKIPA